MPAIPKPYPLPKICEENGFYATKQRSYNMSQSNAPDFPYQFDIPIYFMMGVYDLHYGPAKEYLEALNAPKKQISALNTVVISPCSRNRDDFWSPWSMGFWRGRKNTGRQISAGTKISARRKEDIGEEV